MERLSEFIKCDGLLNTNVIFFQRHLMRHIANINFNQYGNGHLTLLQMNCCICRVSMYACAILYALQNGYTKIYDGARKDQLFAIEQPQMIDTFNEVLFKPFGLELITPLLNYNKNTFEQESELFRIGEDFLLNKTKICKENLSSNALNIVDFCDGRHSTKCFIGQSITEPCSQDCINELDETFRKFMAPILLNEINNYKTQLIPQMAPHVFNHISSEYEHTIGKTKV